MISKTQIDKLGEKIRTDGKNISESTLESLQEYRISHKEALSRVFNILCQYSGELNPASIVTYRIKRFESIIGKLIRFPKMRFSTMGDIGGCRCIFKQERHIYKLRELLINHPSITIAKENDYIKEPQSDGYRSLHLYIKCEKDERLIEVQLRTIEIHNWATLVEITDLLYETSIKELGNNERFGRFHYLLSRVNELTFDEKTEIIRVVKKNKYIKTLNEVFSRNYLQVRKQWNDIESLKSHKVFLIETTKEDIPKIEAFKNATDAEEQYFNVYKTRQNANIVLTHLNSPSYQQISLAYSNYLLTFHAFHEEFFDILEESIFDSISKRKYIKLFKTVDLYFKLIIDTISNFLTEARELHRFSSTNHKSSKQLIKKSKEREWERDLMKQATKSQERAKLFNSKLKKVYPKDRINSYITNKILEHFRNKFKHKIKLLLH